ncbi:MAG: putative DNA binding domain-containing protein [Firmicutes bacterium]|nr:putative DNA binding domain-containing protein [Bacillota bacterium]
MNTMDIENNRPEDQNHEWKISWRDEYMKWLCGYANVQGGHLFIGVNDDGFVVGLRNFRELLEELPNKINTKIGIVASVLYHRASRQGVNIRYGTDGTESSNQKIPEGIRSRDKNLYAVGSFVPQTEAQEKKLEKWKEQEPIFINADGTLDYLEIVVEPYAHMVSYEGRVYKRSGSTLQVLNNLDLEKFVLERSGKTWDEVVVPGLKVADLSREALNLFREKAVRRGRRSRDQVDVTDEVLLSDLNAINEEDEGLYRATLLFFHPNPEAFVTGSYIKIGFFGAPGAYGDNKYNDVIYHDSVHGPLIEQIDRAVEMIYTKYMKALISYDGLQRVETYFWPREAFREVLLNAINNKLYQSGNPIQVKVYDDSITVFNEGHWPVQKLAIEDVYKEHSSYPANPKLASLFFESGEIEAWGSGFNKIREECAKAGAPLPIIEIGDGDTPDKGITIRCEASERYRELQRGEGKRIGQLKSIEASLPETTASDSVARMMEKLSTHLSDAEKERFLPVVEYLKTHNSITSARVKEITGKSKDTSLRLIKRLIDLEVLEKRGDSKNTAYHRR